MRFEKVMFYTSAFLLAVKEGNTDTVRLLLEQKELELNYRSISSYVCIMFLFFIINSVL